MASTTTKAQATMLSQIERIFPTSCSSMKIDVDEIVSARKHRGQLFREQYFDNRFWDIILILYSHAVNERPVDAKDIAGRLEIGHSGVMRYSEILVSDGFVCGQTEAENEGLDIARDRLALTRQGFDNAGAVIDRMRRIFA